MATIQPLRLSRNPSSSLRWRLTLPRLHLSGDDVVQCGTRAEQQAAHRVQALAASGQWRLSIACDDSHAFSQQGMMRIVLAQQLGKWAIGAAHQDLLEVLRDRDQNVSQIEAA